MNYTASWYSDFELTATDILKDRGATLAQAARMTNQAEEGLSACWPEVSGFNSGSIRLGQDRTIQISKVRENISRRSKLTSRQEQSSVSVSKLFSISYPMQVCKT